MSVSDELSSLEQRGRRFASLLLDAGYDSQFVEDAAFAPALRLAKGNPALSYCIAHILAPNTCTAGDYQAKACMLAGNSAQYGRGHAFLAGVLAVIEARAAGADRPPC